MVDASRPTNLGVGGQEAGAGGFFTRMFRSEVVVTNVTIMMMMFRRPSLSMQTSLSSSSSFTSSVSDYYYCHQHLSQKLNFRFFPPR